MGVEGWHSVVFLIFKLIELDAMLIVNLLRKNGHNPNGNDTIIANYKEGLFKILRVKSPTLLQGSKRMRGCTH